MALWIKVFQNNCFVDPTQLPLLCENTGALAIVEPGLMAGGPTVQNTSRPLGRQNCCKVRNFKLCIFDF